ncbi:hypothetical protein Bbelb_156450 [Branchiostoma belcheri]|nr:hypothetical protein Bbelb_156450 [Branchiostoma belcheri]
MASNDGDQSQAKDFDDTQSVISEADSGRGLSVADVSSPDGENQRHVSPNEDQGEEGPGMAVTETDTQQDGQRAPAQEPYGREIASQEGENEELYDGDSSETTTKTVVQPSDTTKRDQGEDVAWQSVYDRKDNVFELLIVDPTSTSGVQRRRLTNVSVNRVETQQEGNITVHATGFLSGDAPRTVRNDRNVHSGLQELSLSERPVVLSFQRGSEVPPHLLRDVEQRGQGKSSQEFFSFVAEHLKAFDKVENCYLLPIQNGLLISQYEVTMGNIQDSTVNVTQITGRGTIVLLRPTVSPDRQASVYSPETETTPGQFTIDGDEPLGTGVEGSVWDAKDKDSHDVFVAKTIPLADFKPAAAAAFLTLTGCKQTCRPYGLVLDEENERVLFLMEKVEGKTLGDILTDPNEQIPIPRALAVDFAKDILKGVQYIHSKRLVHSDVARTISLLNDMLLNNAPESRRSKKYSPWKATDQDHANFDRRTLGKLEKLVEEQADCASNVHRAYTVEKLLQELQEISEELKGSAEASGERD